MIFTTLISVEGLAQFLAQPDWALVDCRFSLAAPEQGRKDYLAAHIPGAVYAHLDQDLSGPPVPENRGRHPLPAPQALAQKLGAWGIAPGVQVVAYDDSGGDMAARLWWLLNWLGHSAVAVLDGGYQAWQRAGLACESRIPQPVARNFVPQLQAQLALDAAQILSSFGDPGQIVIDARAAERYRGEVEPIDPVAGHIPGAVNYPYLTNLDQQGHFQLKQVLRGRFISLLKDIPAEQAVVYCGSGVSATHNILAMAHAGLGMPRLYAGSWSDWIVDPERPIVRSVPPKVIL